MYSRTGQNDKEKYRKKLCQIVQRSVMKYAVEVKIIKTMNRLEDLATEQGISERYSDLARRNNATNEVTRRNMGIETDILKYRVGHKSVVKNAKNTNLLSTILLSTHKYTQHTNTCKVQ